MESGKKRVLIAFLIVIIIAAVGVSYEYHISMNNSKGGSITVTNTMGNKFSFGSTLTRIVSLDPSATSVLYALGAYKDVVATGSYVCYPPNGTSPVICDDFAVNYEKLVNLTPQAVLGYGATTPSYGAYINNTLHIPFILDDPNSISQIENETLMLGTLTGTSSNATKIVNWMNQAISDMKAIRAEFKAESTFYLECEYNGAIYTAGQNTFINCLMEMANLTNIATGSGYYTISPEIIANDTPSAILIDQFACPACMQQAPFNETPAAKNGNYIQFFNDTYFSSSPDFRIIYGMEWLLEWRAGGNTTILNQIQSIPQFPLSLKYPPNFNYEPPA